MLSDLPPPMVICTVTGKCLPVLVASAEAYCPQINRIVYHTKLNSFGESFNAILEQVFGVYEEAIISNDDVVLMPDTMSKLLTDVAYLKQHFGNRLGLVGTYSDNIRSIQNIRYTQPVRKEVQRLSPVFAWVSREAFSFVKFPPLNWYSDDVMCEDLSALGFRHFVSHAYVHHAGSQTTGDDPIIMNAASMPWLEAHRPQYLDKWFKRGTT